MSLDPLSFLLEGTTRWKIRGSYSNLIEASIRGRLYDNVYGVMHWMRAFACAFACVRSRVWMEWRADIWSARIWLKPPVRCRPRRPLPPPPPLSARSQQPDLSSALTPAGTHGIFIPAPPRASHTGSAARAQPPHTYREGFNPFARTNVEHRG